MKTPLPYLLLFTCLLLTCLGAAAEPPAAGITILATFDSPGGGNTIYTYGINERDEIAGTYLETPFSYGFTRMRDGTFVAPLIDPDATGYATEAMGINHAQTVAGTFTDTAGVSHGFLLSDGTYTTYDFPGLGPTETGIFGLNNAGDFCGQSQNTYTGQACAFLTTAAGGTLINIPSSSFTIANGLNDKDEVVGSYCNDYLAFHGFLRQSDGSVIAPLDYPGENTVPRGINNRGIIVGFYFDYNGVFAYVEKLPGTFLAYHYPGAVATRFTGINDKNRIAGYYTDANGVNHGFIAQFH